MRNHIDWLTFTMTMPYGASETDERSLAQLYADTMEQAWLQTFDRETLSLCFGGDWEKNERSRAPYVDAWSLPDTGITLFASPTLTHCCVEVSGMGCERLIKLGALDVVLACVRERVTRIDLACDIETSVTPDQFVEKRTHKRMQADGRQSSKTGTTCYIGSQKSDRYARVYRYNKPHPRAHLLRIEHVFRKDYAKKVASEITENGISSVAFAAGEAFGWRHDVWHPSDNRDADISIVSPERETGKTVFWMLTSVVPAFKRLCENGTIRDPKLFLETYFLGDA